MLATLAALAPAIGLPLLGLLLSGCATSGPLAPLPPVAVSADAAQIVIARESRFVASGATWLITLDGTEVYGLQSGEHVSMRVNPGQRLIGVKYLDLTGREEATMMATIEPGQTYYYRLDPVLGVSRPAINPVSREAGLALMAKTRAGVTR